jgi:RNA polymerase sigma-70 factor (ECF subfamily)
MYASLEVPAEEPFTLKGFYEKYSDFFYSLAKKKLGSKEAAEDAVQTLFLKLISEKEKLSELDESRSVSYAAVILKNHCVDKLRRRRFFLSLDDENTQDLASDELPIEFVAERGNTYALMKEAVSELPERFRLVFEMKYILEMSYDDIARKLNISNAKIGGILRRSRAKIRESMEKDGGEQFL